MGAEIAIIKTGDFETFSERDKGGAVSLGDVLRTTPILSLFSGFSVHWFTSEQAMPLLRRVPRVDRIHTDLGETNFSRFDFVVNLERTEEALRAMDSVPVHRRIGFVRGPSHEPLLRSGDSTWALAEWNGALRSQGKGYWQQWLFALLGREWQGEPYLLNGPDGPETSDVGLNWKVGVKWASKAIPISYWEGLGETLGRVRFISWQEHLNDLDQYIRWVSSCRLILTHDSLGMHLGLALRKKVIVFFSETNESEVHLYDQGEKILLRGEERPCGKKVGKIVSRLLESDGIRLRGAGKSGRTHQALRV